MLVIACNNTGHCGPRAGGHAKFEEEQQVTRVVQSYHIKPPARACWRHPRPGACEGLKRAARYLATLSCVLHPSQMVGRIPRLVADR